MMLAVLYDPVLLQSAIDKSVAGQPMTVDEYNSLIALLGAYRDAMLDDAAALGLGPERELPGNVGRGPIIGYAQVPAAWRVPEGQLEGGIRTRADLADAAGLLMRRARRTAQLVPYTPPAGFVSREQTRGGAWLTGEPANAAIKPTSMPEGHAVLLDPDVARAVRATIPAWQFAANEVRAARGQLPLGQPLQMTAQVQSARGGAQWMGRQFREESKRAENLSLAVAVLGTLAFIGVSGVLRRKRPQQTDQQGQPGQQGQTPMLMAPEGYFGRQGMVPTFAGGVGYGAV
jgi:hypothetical protein